MHAGSGDLVPRILNLGWGRG